MIRPTRYPPAPLSPSERSALTAADRQAIDAWQFQLNGYDPGPDQYARLYLFGKDAGKLDAIRTMTKEPT